MSDYDIEDDLDSIRDYIEDMREMGMDSLEVDMLSKRFPMVDDMTAFLDRLGFYVADDLIILNY
jgi:hypothetical protein